MYDIPAGFIRFVQVRNTGPNYCIIRYHVTGNEEITSQVADGMAVVPDKAAFFLNTSARRNVNRAGSGIGGAFDGEAS